MFNISSRIVTRLCNSTYHISTRYYAAPPKRFYRKTGVVSSNGKYEITLDQRKLKTPKGLPFFVESEPLALAIATEWDAQKEVVDRSTMHLTALSSTVIDNPNNVQKSDIVNYLANYISTDAILFHSNEEKALKDLQKVEWDPVIEWFNKRYDVNIESTHGLEVPTFAPGTAMNISRYLSSYNEAALHGFMFAVDTIKSLILTCACVDRHITPAKAVLLARLEEEYQLGYWERVEWAHDVQQLDSQSRLAAGLLFVYFNSSDVFVKQKIAN
ncbi:ATP synthase mitochondrial F1 complex assembly factor 2 [Toxorhynchites rutilus septentrionalis]|uniref:ATP synthase mitochondrial F1 complex assembly factor 2 n=1 Tax=Toxorhynchites rutilus septentrionalis TaxID=329112 RepID=UPI0024795668|nr:ATP synthase mitochondrial F1 complex assembly factor 2 [Toxorhynchites rutilus septentrionalis]